MGTLYRLFVYYFLRQVILFDDCVDYDCVVINKAYVNNNVKNSKIVFIACNTRSKMTLINKEIK